jgi:hypothetical protein
VVCDTQSDEVFDRGGVDVAGDDGDDHRVADGFPGGVAFEPCAAVTGADRRGCPVPGPPGPVLPDPLILQRGVLIPLPQLREIQVDQGLDRLPGRLGQQI